MSTAPPDRLLRLWSDAFRHCSHGIAVGDPQTNRILACNDSYARLIGRSADAVVGVDISSLYAPFDRERVRAELENADRRGDVRLEASLVAADGSLVPVQVDVVSIRDEAGRLVWRVATVEDITERRRAAAIVAEHQARLSAIVESAMDAIVSVDEHQRVVLSNRAADDMFGYEPGGLIGRALEDLVPRRFRAGHGKHVRLFGEQGATRRRMGGMPALYGARRDGSEFPIEASISQAQLSGGRVYTAVIRDVSTQRALERDLLEAGERERRRMSGDLHDGIGPILTGLRYLCDATQRRLPDPNAPIAGELRKISDELGQALASVRLLARGLAPVDLERSGLGPALRELASHSSQRFGLACSATVDDQSAARVDVNAASHLYRIAQEGVTNAAKHSGAARVDISLVAGRDDLLLTVSDDGSGMPAGAMTRGNGLGLRSMEYRARLLQGSLTIGTRAPHGTSLTCRCPLPRNAADGARRLRVQDSPAAAR